MTTNLSQLVDVDAIKKLSELVNSLKNDRLFVKTFFHIVFFLAYSKLCTRIAICFIYRSVV